jgi:hypothetical protein
MLYKLLLLFLNFKYISMYGNGITAKIFANMNDYKYVDPTTIYNNINSNYLSIHIYIK